MTVAARGHVQLGPVASLSRARSSPAGPDARRPNRAEAQVSEDVLSRAQTWDEVFARTSAGERSWDGADLSWSTDLLDRADPGHRSVVDIGCGESALIEALIASRWQEITLLDVSAVALARVAQRLDAAGLATARVELVAADLLDWQPERTFTAWHDRAVLHFLTDPADRAAYVRLAGRAVVPGGALVLGGFAVDGPEKCSGQPVARRSPEALAAEFAADFTCEDAWTRVHITPWEAEQWFTWVLLRRQARD